MNHIKRRELFDREVRRLLLSLGAKQDPTRGVPWSCYILDTAAGPLDISVHTDLWLSKRSWATGGGAPWIATRFDNVKAAHALTCGESNSYSGKWNHHLWSNWTDDFTSGLRLLEFNLRRILLTLASRPEERSL